MNTEIPLEGNRSCFIVTPIGPPDSELRRSADGVINAVLRPVLQDFGFEIYAQRLVPGNQEKKDNKGNSHYEAARIFEKAN
ncbi:hypothetical protein ACFLX5_03870 [Chloroflexota bacterium]